MNRGLDIIVHKANGQFPCKECLLKKTCKERCEKISVDYWSKEYGNNLVDNNTCPACGGRLNDMIITNLVSHYTITCQECWYSIIKRRKKV